MHTVAGQPAVAARDAAVATPSMRPVVLFFLLAFSIPWAAAGIAIAQNYGALSGQVPLEPFLVLGSWTPNLAAFLVLAFVIRRRRGIRELLLGWTRWNTSPGWYLVALSPLLFGLLTVALIRGALGQPPVEGAPAGAGIVVATLVLALITGATGEELGWRGFALPRLQTRMNALAASIVLGLVWGFWHLPLWFAGFGWEEMSFWLFTLNCVAFSVIATWVCNSTHARLVIVSLMHLFFNFGLFIASDAVLIPRGQALAYCAAMMTAFAMVVVLVEGPETLSRRKRVPVDRGEGVWREA